MDLSTIAGSSSVLPPTTVTAFSVSDAAQRANDRAAPSYGSFAPAPLPDYQGTAVDIFA